jgi:hypothetical protein
LVDGVVQPGGAAGPASLDAGAVGQSSTRIVRPALSRLAVAGFSTTFGVFDHDRSMHQLSVSLRS